jgi:spore germination cell wall hydrolase CwlJ-like protein
MKLIIIWVGLVIALSATSSPMNSKDFVPSPEDIQCLAMNMYFEARGEGTKGKLAVATVTLNRAAHPAFPSSICEVVYQKTKIKTKTICQFSWYCDKSLSLRENSKQYKVSVELAIRVFVEGLHIKELKNALYFHNATVVPNWKLVKVATIGNHTFYSNTKKPLSPPN